MGIYSAALLLQPVGGITKLESENFISSLNKHYQAMRLQRGRFATPLISTYLGRQSSKRSDLLVVSPVEEKNESSALIFLHGAGGIWSLLCWLVSEIAAKESLHTFCPSAGTMGNWNSKTGRAVLQNTIRYVKSQGLEPRILAGLSAGAQSASKLIEDFESEFSALILLYGAHAAGAQTQLPTLLVYGENDERFPKQHLLAAAGHQRRRGALVTLESVDGDHFALVKRFTPNRPSRL